MSKIYKIQSGDTLSKIADRFSLSLDSLLRDNPQYKANPNKIKVGDIVAIFNEEVIKTSQELNKEVEELAKKEVANLTSDDSKLGALSIKYEVGNRGPGTVSTGKGDAGGISYGSYQMIASNVKKFVSEEDFPFRDRFNGLVPTTPEFTKVWKEIASEDSKRFHKLQHDFIKKTHFDPLVNKIKAQTEFDVLTRSNAIQDVVWSTAVQHGPASSLIQKVLGNFATSARNDVDFDRRLIKAIYAERGRKNPNGTMAYFSKNSPAVQKSAANRFINEEKDALAML